MHLTYNRLLVAEAGEVTDAVNNDQLQSLRQRAYCHGHQESDPIAPGEVRKSVV